MDDSLTKKYWRSRFGRSLLLARFLRIVTGATGVGKTYILSAFGREACVRGFEVRCFRVPRMLTDLSIGRGDGSYNKLLANMTKPDLLILDDFGLKQIDLA